MPVKWKQWIAELEGLSADSPEWNEFAEFLAASQNIATVKSQEREAALESVGQALTLLKERHSSILLRFGLMAALEWQAEQCPPTYALRASQDLKRWEDALEAYDELLVRVPSNPTEFQAQRRQRNDLEDEIAHIGFELTAIFNGEELPLEAAVSDNSQESNSAPTAVPPARKQSVATVSTELTVSEPVMAPEPQRTAAIESQKDPQDALRATVVREEASRQSPGIEAQTKTRVEESDSPLISNGHNGNGHHGNGHGTGVSLPELKLISSTIPVVPSEEKVPEDEAPTLPALSDEVGAPSDELTVESAIESRESVTTEEAVGLSEVSTVTVGRAAEVVPLAEQEETGQEEVEDAEERDYPPCDCDIVAQRSTPVPYLADDEPTSVSVLEQEEAGGVEDASEGDEDDCSNGGVLLADGRRLLRIFISSPGDVGQERLIAAQVIERLQTEFAAYIELDPVFWEHEPLRATSHFQEQIMAPSKCDIMVCILWARLGTRLPGQFHRADGSLYDSGTEWEFEDALSSYQVRGTPDLMVYRKSAEPQASMSDEAALMARLSQKRALDTFIDRWFGNAQSSFKAAFHQFPSPDAFEDLLENHLRRLIRERLPERITEGGEAPLTIRWHKGSPFRSLEAFDLEHAAIFCGRTRAISELKEALIHQASQGRPFVVVFGMSGSGKSSLVRAGLLPTLLQPGVIDGVGYWRYAMFNPGDGGGLLEGLASALLKETALPELAQNGLEANDLAMLLKESPERLIGPLRAALLDAAECAAQCENLHEVPVARLALVIDQMEEIWTEEEADDQTRRDFMAAINVLVRSGLVWTTATMRSDFFPRCDEIPDLMSLKEGAGQYHLLPPTFAEIGQMLNQPARLAGLRFEVDPKTGNNLSDVLQEAAGKDHGALPLLQFTLDELFKRRSPDGVLSFAAYEELGGVEGALAGRAEEMFEALPPNVQTELPAVLRALVTVIADGDNGDVKVAARRAPWESLAVSPQRRQLVEAFIDARLLVSDGHEVDADGFPHSGIVRVAHEALLRHWPRLQEWLANDMKFLRIRARTATSAAHWMENELSREYLLHAGLILAEAEDMLLTREAELEPTTVRFIRESSRVARRARLWRRGIITGVTAAFFFVVTSFGGFSYVKWQQTERERARVTTLITNMAYQVPDKLAAAPAAREAMKQIFQKNLSVLNQVLDKDDASLEMRREKATNLDRIGDIWFNLGEFPKAQSAYEQSLKIMTRLVQEENTPERRRDLANCLDKVASIRLNSNNLKAAKDLYSQSLSIRRALTDDTPSPDLLRELSVSYEQVAAVERQNLDYKDSLSHLSQSWSIRSRLYTLAPNKSQPIRDLVVCAINMSDIYLDANKPQKEGQVVDEKILQSNIKHASQAIERALPLARENATPDNPEGQHDLANVYDRLGALYNQSQEQAKALQYIKQGIPIYQELAKGNDDWQAQKDYADALNSAANLHLELNNEADFNKALDYFGKVQPILEALAKERKTLDIQTALLDCYMHIADTQSYLHNWMPAHAAYALALKQCSAIQQQWPDDTHCVTQAAASHGQLAYIKINTKQYAAALQEAKLGASLDPTASWITTTLVEAYVLNNQLQPAQQLCMQHRNEAVTEVPFGQVVINDLDAFLQDGISNPNFAKMRAWIVASKLNIATRQTTPEATPKAPATQATPFPALPAPGDSTPDSSGDNSEGVAA